MPTNTNTAVSPMHGFLKYRVLRQRQANGMAKPGATCLANYQFSGNARESSRGHTYNVIIHKASYPHGSPNIRAIFDKIPRVGSPLAECRIETLEI
jgi:hypothetical protein